MPPSPDIKPAISPITDPFTSAFALGRYAQQAAGSVQGGEGGIPFMVLDKEHVETVSVEQFGAAPARIRQTPQFSDTPSFIAYVNDFKDSGTRIFADFGDTGGSFRAALDYHNDPMTPRWGDHLALYNCPVTPEWSAWMERDGLAMTQEQFANFAEEQRLAFVEPDAATMLEIARTLEASTSGQFKSEINLQNGNRHLVYKSDVDASAGGSRKIAIPAKITIRLQPFRRGLHHQLIARLSYRIREGKVSFQYDLERAYETIEIALQAISADIETKTGITPYNGSL